MNERVVFKVELYKQALKFAYETAGVDTENGTILASLTAGRFAELIVRECLEQIDKIRDGCEDDGEDQQALGADWAGLAVARYFGVEE